MQDTPAAVPFWREKSLAEMSHEEWESLCDGCARCCLVKLMDEDGDEDEGPFYFTNVSCRLLDAGACRCRDYANRASAVPDCVSLTATLAASLAWLPPTCAYRVLAEGGDLAWWHPLVSGDPQTVHLAGISVRGRTAATEDEVPVEALQDHIVAWPGQVPKRSRRRPGPGLRSRIAPFIQTSD